MNLLRIFNNSDAYESEGCVFDDENNLLFISEENKKGVLRSYELATTLTLDDEFIIDDRNGYIVGDPEGLAILKQQNNKGYLIASSQGSSSFNVYQRNRPHTYITSFKIGGNQYIDEVSDTDGIEIVNIYLNENFSEGIMVVQDGKILVKKQFQKRTLNLYR